MISKILSLHHRKLFFVAFLLFVFLMPSSNGQQSSNTEGCYDANGTYVCGNNEDGQVEVTPDSSAFNFKASLREAFKQISTSFRTMQEHAIDISQSPGIKQLTYILGWSLGLIALFIPASKYMMSADPENLSDLIHNMLIIGVVVSLTMVPSNYRLLMNAIRGTFSDLAASILSGSSETSQFDQMIEVMGSVFKGISDNMPSGSAIWTNFKFTILAIFLGLLCFIFILVSLFFMIIYTNIGNVLMSIAMVLGPIFIVLSILKVTRTFFEKWLHFMLIACMYQVVAAVIMKLISIAPLIPGGALGKESIASASNIIAITFTMAALAWISSMIPDIVNAMMPGQIGGLGGAGGKAFKQGTERAKSTRDWINQKLREKQ